MIDAGELAVLFDEAGRAIDPFGSIMASPATGPGTGTHAIPEGWEQRKATADVLYAIGAVYRHAAEKAKSTT